MKTRINISIKIVLVAIFIFSSIIFSSDKTEAKRYNMSYLYFGRTDSFINKVVKTNNSVDTVAPSYFDIVNGGYLSDKVDPYFVEKMHEMNVRVVPFLSNHWNRTNGRIALENREALASQLASLIEYYELDGINIDFEGLNEEDRDNFTDFIRLLREQIPEEKELSVAVAVNPEGWTKGWQASYDYEGLAKYSNYLMLMAYDESYRGSASGPVASIDFVENSIKYALKSVPPEKIVLGLPFYGRYWKVGESYGGRGITLNKIDEMMQEFNSTVYFDEKTKSPYTVITIPYGLRSDVYDRTLNPGKYVIWFENDESVKIKLKLVQKYNLLGTGSWSLNQAPDSFWNFYQSWLNGEHYFIDAENHWAERAILSVREKGWMLGTSDDYFSPNKPLSRVEGTVVLVRALGLLENNSDQDNLSISQLFTDLDSNYWANRYIETAYQQGIIKGMTEDTFAPNAPLTREQMAVMLSRAFNYRDAVNVMAYQNPFADVSVDYWAYQDIAALNLLNIFTGYEDGKFYPKDNVTRAQMAVLMNRISNVNNSQEEDDSVTNPEDDTTIPSDDVTDTNEQPNTGQDDTTDSNNTDNGDKTPSGSIKDRINDYFKK